ncbi:TetR family transcriptional regulator [Halomonas sp. FeN2]|uniref:TetR family transcriptional regulator n=1 Tax=Vreelandella neptunia TaxID=115551 RepID=A0ABZ0YIY2_9GAMM|nr:MULTISPECIES: TetR family transcriptional regulator [Halomonas]TDV97684.1 TetR family transcriptional regulator [Halomonas alkaliantarctica]MBF58039.1 TetR family transcriptional regulator [Halomonas sp.]MDN3562363.1 TetR family transcriptional regulator [Halomonas neptunia]UBR51408.1 TetR family transcriptional regulator [Halomonas sp. FeN2]WQH12059.1 TetR family transcriptional regulator [Halomonas neptunia]|tara:strand:+ start:7969 stop:8592 length:624 start_codon:yes stop_codon:yes gene_type:complete
MSRRKADAERTRETILDAAETTFLAQGVSRTTLAHIAQAAGVTRGAIYWHFEDKAALFDALLERVRVPLDEIVDEVVARLGSAPADCLREIALRSLAAISHDLPLQRAATIVLHRCEKLEEEHPRICMITRLSEHAEARVEQLFEQAQVAGTLRADLTPASARRQFHGFLIGVCFDWLQDTQQHSLADESSGIVETLMRGLLVENKP